MNIRATLFTFFLFCSAAAHGQIHTASDTTKASKLNPIVVTGSGHHQRLKSTASPVRVLSAAQIREQGITSLQDALIKMLPQIQMTPSSMGNFLRLNGLGNKYALILVNGRRIIGDMAGNVDLDRIDLSRVKRIEVLDGAASSLYGSDAIGGVINIITDDRTTDLISARSQTSASGKGRFVQSASLNVGKGGVNSATSFSHSRADSFSNNGYEEVTKDGETVLQKTIAPLFSGYRADNFSERLSLKASKSLAMNAGFDYYDKITSRPRTREDVSGGTDYEMRYRGVKASAGGIYKFNRNYSIQLNLDADRYRYGREYQVDGKTYEKGDYTRSKKQQAYSGNLQGIMHLTPTSTSIAGIDFRRDELESSSGNIDNGANTFAAYLQHEMTIVKGLSLTAGARLTSHQDFGSNFSPKAALMYSPGDFRFRATYSRGFRTPGLDELHYNYFSLYRGKPQISIGSTDLKPETSDYFSLNAEYHTDFLTVSATGFLNYVDGMIIKKNIAVDDAMRAKLMAMFPEMTEEQAAKLEKYALYSNSDKGRVQGLNLNISAIAARDLEFGLNWAWNYARTKSGEEWSVLERSVRNTLTLSSDWHHGWGIYDLNIRLSARLQSKTYYPGYENAPGYGVWNINTTHKFRLSEKLLIEPSFGIDNIFDRKDSRPDSSLRKYALFSPGRMITAGLRIIFD
ncbi:MAG: TonB-dependent receptor [Bacteroidales bacterium]|nr:TonB-dependent receptor [Bacteroidales bacterium]